MPGEAVAPTITGWPRLHREALALREWASTRNRATWPAPPRGGGRPAMLIPGFLAGDASLARMGAWLRSGGFAMARPGITSNTACMAVALETLEARLEAAVHDAGRPALVVGQSRGGSLGRALAARRPDLVDALVALGSPLRDQFAVHPALWVSIGVVGLLGTLGVPGCFSASCRRGECCAAARADLAGPFPPGVRFLAFYSRRDGIVKWQACLDPAAEAVEVRTSHGGMGVDAGVWRELAARLATV